MIRRIQPPWLRLLVLALVGLPMISGWPLRDAGSRLNELTRRISVGVRVPTSTGAEDARTNAPNALYCHQGHTPAHALVWLIYASGVSILIVINVGPREWFVFFSIASLLTTVTCLTGAVVSSARNVIFGNADSQAQALWSVHYLVKACIMLSVVPFGMFAVGCFSPSNMLQAAIQHGRAFQSLTIRLTTIVRVLQHVLYVVVALFGAWREENPDLIVPRHRVDMRGNVAAGIAKWAAWGEESLRTWCFALLMHTLEPIPLFCREIEQASRILYLGRGDARSGIE